MRFVYRGPPDEPECPGTMQALTGKWVTGVPREIADPAHIAWLSRHPHWEVTEAKALPVDSHDPDAHEPYPVPARRGRPPKVR